MTDVHVKFGFPLEEIRSRICDLPKTLGFSGYTATDIEHVLNIAGIHLGNCREARTVFSLGTILRTLYNEDYYEVDGAANIVLPQCREKLSMLLNRLVQVFPIKQIKIYPAPAFPMVGAAKYLWDVLYPTLLEYTGGHDFDYEEDTGQIVLVGTTGFEFIPNVSAFTYFPRALYTIYMLGEMGAIPTNYARIYQSWIYPDYLSRRLPLNRVREIMRVSLDLLSYVQFGSDFLKYLILMGAQRNDLLRDKTLSLEGGFGLSVDGFSTYMDDLRELQEPMTANTQLSINVLLEIDGLFEGAVRQSALYVNGGGIEFTSCLNRFSKGGAV